MITQWESSYVVIVPGLLGGWTWGNSFGVAPLPEQGFAFASDSVVTRLVLADGAVSAAAVTDGAVTTVTLHDN